MPQFNLYINQLNKQIIKLVYFSFVIAVSVIHFVSIMSYFTLMFHFHLVLLTQFLLAEKFFSMLVTQHP